MATLPVRPPVWPPAPQIQPGRADARIAAQKAFFQAALAGQPVEAPAATPVATAAQATRAVAATAESADALPRPGSIIDIKV